MLNDIKMGVIMISVIMLNVMAPFSNQSVIIQVVTMFQIDILVQDRVKIENREHWRKGKAHYNLPPLMKSYFNFLRGGGRYLMVENLKVVFGPNFLI